MSTRERERGKGYPFGLQLCGQNHSVLRFAAKRKPVLERESRSKREKERERAHKI